VPADYRCHLVTVPGLSGVEISRWTGNRWNRCQVNRSRDLQVSRSPGARPCEVPGLSGAHLEVVNRCQVTGEQVPGGLLHKLLAGGRVPCPLVAY